MIDVGEEVFSQVSRLTMRLFEKLIWFCFCSVTQTFAEPKKKPPLPPFCSFLVIEGEVRYALKSLFASFHLPV